MKTPATRTRIVLVILAALLALPFASTGSPVGARNRARTVTQTFRNPAPMNLPVSQLLPKSASLYPSTITVRGLKGTIRDVNVRLKDFTHANGADVQVLLVGPDGQTAILMADVGEETEANGAITLRLDQEAAAAIPDETLPSGVFRPTNHNGRVIAFNEPAPSAGTRADLSVFDGGDPNGAWRLFVQDAFMPTDAGTVAGGWDLEITTRFKAKKKR